jgi:hypothetical protein
MHRRANQQQMPECKGGAFRPRPECIGIYSGQGTFWRSKPDIYIVKWGDAFRPCLNVSSKSRMHSGNGLDASPDKSAGCIQAMACMRRVTVPGRAKIFYRQQASKIKGARLLCVFQHINLQMSNLSLYTTKNTNRCHISTQTGLVDDS